MHAKEIRKQIRNIMQEEAEKIAATEVAEIVKKDLTTQINTKLDSIEKMHHERLDSIEKFCQEQLAKQDKRAKAVQSFIVQEVMGRIQNDLFNANVTIEAVEAVLADAGLGIEDFTGKVDAKKLEISERKKKESDEAMKAEMERRATEEKAKQEVKPEQKAE